MPLIASTGAAPSSSAWLTFSNFPQHEFVSDRSFGSTVWTNDVLLNGRCTLLANIIEFRFGAGIALTSSSDSMSKMHDSSNVVMQSAASSASSYTNDLISLPLKQSVSQGPRSSIDSELLTSVSGQFSAMHDSSRRRCWYGAAMKFGSGDEGAVDWSKMIDDGPELQHSSVVKPFDCVWSECNRFSISWSIYQSEKKLKVFQPNYSNDNGHDVKWSDLLLNATSRSCACAIRGTMNFSIK